MRILHIVPGLDEPTNGIANAAKRIALEQMKLGHEARCVETRLLGSIDLQGVDVAFVHSMWLPMTIKAAWRVWRSGVKLVRMPHGCMDPVKFRYHRTKKLLMLSFDWLMFRLADACYVTCDVEAKWMRRFNKRIVNVPLGVDVEAVADATEAEKKPTTCNQQLGQVGVLKVLFVGRMHPLKGLDCLLEAMVGVECSLDVIGYDEKGMMAHYVEQVKSLGIADRVRFRGVVSEAEKAAAFESCDVFCLPTMSENFGIVIGEALAHGKSVITTDGAPVWANMPKACGTYLEGFVQSTQKERVRKLRAALEMSAREARGHVDNGEFRRGWIRKNFDWRINMERLLKWLER